MQPPTRTRSGSGISAIFASTSASPSASALGPLRPAALNSRARSFIAPRSSSVKLSSVVSLAVALLLADFGVSFNAGFLSAIEQARPLLSR
jgi:hypothetical protein